MRLGEFVQLRTDDVARVDWVDVIPLRLDDQDDKRQKTRASERIVPIHSQLKKIGFVTYVEKVREYGELRLSPELRKGKAATTAILSKIRLRDRF
jgi:integrase